MTSIAQIRFQAKESKFDDKLVIYTDFNCPTGFRSKLKTYASRDFHSYRGPQMKNAGLLKELHELSRDMNVSSHCFRNAFKQCFGIIFVLSD